MDKLEAERGLTVAEIAEFFRGEVLKLDSFKNKWNNPLAHPHPWEDLREEEALDRCPNSRRYARFIVEDAQGKTSQKFVYLRCKQWSCPYCARVNAQVLYVKVKRGIAGCVADELRDGFRDEYYVKFLTLTLPGREWRDAHSKLDAAAIIKHSFKKLMYQLRRKLGHIEYFWVMEFQRDGFAHLHVVLIGSAIAPKSVKADIEKIWREQQGLGFIKFNAVEGGLNRVSSYLSKYITKELQTGNKGAHVYGASYGFHKAVRVGRPEITMVEIGRWTMEDGQYIFTPLWRIGDFIKLEDLRPLQQIEQDEAEDLWHQMLLPFP